MITWIKKLFTLPEDEIEREIKELFCFLIEDYGFSFASNQLGNAVDKNGKFVFYGPLNAYQIYNEMVCINVLYLVQRQDYQIFVTDRQSIDQPYIRSGIEMPSYFAYDLPRFAREIKAELSYLYSNQEDTISKLLDVIREEINHERAFGIRKR